MQSKLFGRPFPSTLSSRNSGLMFTRGDFAVHSSWHANGVLQRVSHVSNGQCLVALFLLGIQPGSNHAVAMPLSFVPTRIIVATHRSDRQNPRQVSSVNVKDTFQAVFTPTTNHCFLRNAQARNTKSRVVLFHTWKQFSSHGVV